MCRDRPGEERVETLSNHALCLRRHACHAPPTLTRLSASVSPFLSSSLSSSRLASPSFFFSPFPSPPLVSLANQPTGPLARSRLASPRLSFSLFLPFSLFLRALPRRSRTYGKKRRALLALGATNFRVVDEKYDYVERLFTRMAQTAATIANRRTAMSNAIILDFVILFAYLDQDLKDIASSINYEKCDYVDSDYV